MRIHMTGNSLFHKLEEDLTRCTASQVLQGHEALNRTFHKSCPVQPGFARKTHAQLQLSMLLLSTCNYTCHSVKPQHQLRSLSQLCPGTWKTYYMQKKMSLLHLCFHHLAEILEQGKKGRLESRLKRHTWCFLHKDYFGILQKVMASQYHFFPSNNRKAVSTLLLHQRQFLGRSLSWRVIKKIKRQPQTHTHK